MFKKYIKLALLFFVPVFLTILYSAVDELNNGHFSTTSARPEVGFFSYPSVPYFGSMFDNSILIMYLVAGIMSFFIFTELRSQKIGGFLSSLPVKKTWIYFSVFCGGVLLITLSFLLMDIIFFNELEKVFPSVQEVFTANGKYDEGVKLINLEREDNYTACLFYYFSTICAYSVLTFVQTMFQKPIGAVCALVGGVFGSVFCLMTVSQYSIILGKVEISGARWEILEHIVSSRMLGSLVFVAITMLVFFLGMWLYQKGERAADQLFTFPAVRIIMLFGITVCSGSLAVFSLFNRAGTGDLSLWMMNVVFVLAGFVGWAVARKIFKLVC